jgi:hypothetical protein
MPPFHPARTIWYGQVCLSYHKPAQIGKILVISIAHAIKNMPATGVCDVFATCCGNNLKLIKGMSNFP